MLSFLKNKLKKLTCFNHYLKKKMKKEKLLTRKNYIQQNDQLTGFTIFLQNYLNSLDLITNDHMQTVLFTYCSNKIN